MQFSATKSPRSIVQQLGIQDIRHVHYQLSPGELAAQAVSLNQAEYDQHGVLVVHTGEFTGRSPKDRFLVKDAATADQIDWNSINLPAEEFYFDRLYTDICNYFRRKHIWMRDCYACADPRYRLNLRVITETPWSNLFCYNMFLRPAEERPEEQAADWLLLQAPGFRADPVMHGTRRHNFAVIHFTRKTILIGGTAYTGEIKKAVFSVLNYLLPQQDVLSMHCAANMGKRGDTALFFGLSGTGKTTLSTDPSRRLIGDDEHGWGSRIFNFEGGCYAKCIDLSEEKEPQIYGAIRRGALLENICFYPDTDVVNYADNLITENTRVSYPLSHIENAAEPSLGPAPEHIFFLTCDAYGVLPPISRLTCEQAMYHFISGYTAKVAGTETGVTEPKATFSACFGAPFLPLHPVRYARMLGERIRANQVNCWLINTGWTGGPYGTGSRIRLSYTRSMVTAVLSGSLNGCSYATHKVFGLAMPAACPGVPAAILDPRATWNDPEAYDRQAADLARQFVENFSQYSEEAGPGIRAAAPHN